MALFRPVYPNVPVARKSTTPLATPTVIRQDYENNRTDENSIVHANCVDNFSFKFLKRLFLCHYEQKIFFRGKNPGKIHIFKSERSVSIIFACSIYINNRHHQI